MLRSRLIVLGSVALGLTLMIAACDSKDSGISQAVNTWLPTVVHIQTKALSITVLNQSTDTARAEVDYTIPASTAPNAPDVLLSYFVTLTKQGDQWQVVGNEGPSTRAEAQTRVAHDPTLTALAQHAAATNTAVEATRESHQATQQAADVTNLVGEEATATAQAPYEEVLKDKLNAVYMISSTEGWAGGDNGALVHYKDGIWSRVQSLTRDPINAIQMLSATEGWAVGGNGVETMGLDTESILHYKDGAWQLISSPAKFNLKAISMVSSDEGWAAGNDNQYLLHYSLGNWATRANPMYTAGASFVNDISMISPTEGWAVGIQGTLLHYSAGKWKQIVGPSTPTGFSYDLNAVQMLSATDGWIVGEGVDVGGTFLHYTSGKWTVVSNPTDNNLHKVYLTSADSGWAVGVSGIILRYQNGGWSKVNSPTDKDLYGLYMLSPNDGWAVGGKVFDGFTGGGVILHYQNGGWQLWQPPQQ